MQNNGNWKCYQLKDQGIYYGEIAYIKPSGELVLQESLTPEERQHLPKVRHGQGVQIFPATQGLLCKYQGHWHKDKKHGKGECSYPNGDTYVGEFQEDKRHGTGVYTWQDHKKYEGEWKIDRMDGVGCFVHPSSFEVRGEFKSNYYMVSPDLVLNPFIEGESLKEEIKLQEETRKRNLRNLEMQQKQVRIHRIADMRELVNTIKNIDKAARVPLILGTAQSFLRKEDVLGQLGSNVQEIDLRYMVNMLKSQGREAVREHLRDICIEVFKNGGYLVLNLDDSSVQYNELYYPDLQDFYHPQSFPVNLFKPEVMKRIEVFTTFLDKEQFDMAEYNFCIWSKSRFDEALNDQDLLGKIEKKFGKVFSLDSIDLVFCGNPIEEED